MNDPADPGGATNFGISQRYHPDLDIEHLTKDQAIEIYHVDWWLFFRYGEIANDEIAAKVFDLAVNMGPKNAHALLQRSVSRSGGDWLDIDGELGDLTIRAVNRHPCQQLCLLTIEILAVAYYIELSDRRKDRKHLAGWIKRVVA